MKTRQLDLHGAWFPHSLLRIQEEVDRIAPRQRIEIVGDDPGLAGDLKLWTSANQVQLGTLRSDGPEIHTSIEVPSPLIWDRWRRPERDPNRRRALGLLSGGLDSSLAIALLQDQGIEVLGLHFYTGFSEIESHRVTRRALRGGSQKYSSALKTAASQGVPIRIVDISGPRYLDMMLAPRHGYGKHVNPCIDCHLMMLQEARIMLGGLSADFVFSGEVLGQRPKSQRAHALQLIAGASGLEDRLLRPLSARALPPSLPERMGWVRREDLEGIVGRSRARQLELAQKFGLDDFPTPAGGCILTDENFSLRFRDLIAHTPEPRSLELRDFLLLTFGRHFRLNERVEIVIGRDEGENLALEQLAGDRWQLEAQDVPGPLTLVRGAPIEEDLLQIAAITAGYGKGRDAAEVVVCGRRKEEERQWRIAPLATHACAAWRIERAPGG